MLTVSVTGTVAEKNRPDTAILNLLMPSFADTSPRAEYRSSPSYSAGAPPSCAAARVRKGAPAAVGREPCRVWKTAAKQIIVARSTNDANATVSCLQICWS